MVVGTGAAPINTLTGQENIMFEEMEIRIEDLQELKQVFIAAARAPNLGTLWQAHPELQNTVRKSVGDSTPTAVNKT